MCGRSIFCICVCICNAWTRWACLAATLWINSQNSLDQKKDCSSIKHHLIFLYPCSRLFYTVLSTNSHITCSHSTFTPQLAKHKRVIVTYICNSWSMVSNATSDLSVRGCTTVSIKIDDQGNVLDGGVLVYPFHRSHCYDPYPSIPTRVDFYDTSKRPLRWGHWLIA